MTNDSTITRAMEAPPRRSRLRAAVNLVLMLAVVAAIGGGLAALLTGCGGQHLGIQPRPGCADLRLVEAMSPMAAATAIVGVRDPGTTVRGLVGDTLLLNSGEIPVSFHGGTVA